MSVEGQWNVTMDTPLGKQQFTLSFTQAAGTWSGSMVGGRTGTSELTGIKVEGQAVSFETNVNSPMGSIKLSMSGNVAGDALSGVCKTSFGDANFTGVRA
jgi:hypothetical protein